MKRLLGSEDLVGNKGWRKSTEQALELAVEGLMKENKRLISIIRTQQEMDKKMEQLERINEELKRLLKER